MLGFAGILTALTAFACYRWSERQRAARVDAWVRSFLATRYGALPEHLHIICTDDRRWPVLVSFDRSASGTRHLLHFICAGASSRFFLKSETEEHRTPAH